MKPWEETWTADENGYLRNSNGDCIFIGDAQGDGCAIRPARAKLAAHAPAMARMLLRFLEDDYDAPTDGGRVELLLRAAGVIS